VVVIIYQGLAVAVQRSNLYETRIISMIRSDARDESNTPESSSLSRFRRVANDEVVINCS